MSRKIISVFIILLMISSLSFSVFAETLNEKKEDVKSKIEEQNQKLEYVQGEISDAVKEIEEIDDKIKDCESQIEDLKTKLAESKKNMDEVTEKYNKVKAEYDKNEKLFQERMVALYEAGDTTYLDLLLTSGSITDFISNYYLVSQLAECDTEEITKDSLRNFNIPYDSLNLHISDKLTFCKENGIELLIEDSYETCIELTDNGIKSILMTTKMNADINDDGITRVNNWDEVYQKIQEMKETCKEQEDVR